MHNIQSVNSLSAKVDSWPLRIWKRGNFSSYSVVSYHASVSELAIARLSLMWYIILERPNCLA